MKQTGFPDDGDVSPTEAHRRWQARTGEARLGPIRTTAAADGRLHQHPDQAALLRCDLRLPTHITLLLRILGRREPTEKMPASHQLAPWAGWTVHDESSPRATRLGSDLAALGASAVSVAAAPTAGALLTAMKTQLTATGCGWVVEGSALCGRGTILDANTKNYWTVLRLKINQRQRWQRRLTDAMVGIFRILETCRATET